MQSDQSQVFGELSWQEINIYTLLYSLFKKLTTFIHIILFTFAKRESQVYYKQCHNLDDLNAVIDKD